MIITSLRAENILKYKALELNDIPRTGVIAISGSNESGKSTIGETLCFALFGRTFSINEDNLDKLFHWGAPQCSVTLDFLVEEQPFRLYRSMNIEDEHTVRLTIPDDPEPIASGIEDVSDTLLELLGFEYDEYIDSFYLAQREITKPHPHSYAVKSMAGIASVEYVMFDLEEEIDEDQRIIDQNRTELEDIDTEISAIAVSPEHLAELEAEQDLLARAEARGREHMSRLKKTTSAYQQAVANIRKSAQVKENMVNFQLISMAAAAVFAGIWWLLGGNDGSSGIADLIRTLFTGWEGYAQIFKYANLAAIVMLFVFMARYWIVHLSNDKWRKCGLDLASELDGIAIYSRSSEMEYVLKAESSQVQSVRDLMGDEDKIDFSEEKVLRLRGEVRNMDADGEQVVEAGADILAWLRFVINIQRDLAAIVARAVQHERQNQERVRVLEDLMPPLEKVIQEHDDRVVLHEDALGLLRGAGLYMSRKFNRELRDLAAHTLPMFTEGRYQHLQIDEDLNVRVFSSEKRDYMSLEEVSSGTQRQIMLAIRLALAQQVVQKSVEGEQFVFLDEPFAFFDEDRTRSSVKVMRRMSEEITQIWVVSQEFPKRLKYESEIFCIRESDILTDEQPEPTQAPAKSSSKPKPKSQARAKSSPKGKGKSS